MLADLDNSLQVDMSPHPDILTWFKANKSLLLLHTTACLVEKQQIHIL
jgi:hypothetical protein